MHSTIARAAVLPFQIIESLGIGCGYERSFKLSPDTILANRYLLGVSTADVTPDQLIDMCRKMGMPLNFLETFCAGLESANLVLLGFEADEKGGALYKVYLEYWDLVQAGLRHHPSTDPYVLLHKGFKWQYDNPENNLVTDYQYHPGLTASVIIQRIESLYRDTSTAIGLDATLQIVSLAEQRTTGNNFLYIEVSEPCNSRKSFDINFYSANMRIEHIAKPVASVAARETTVICQILSINQYLEFIRL